MPIRAVLIDIKYTLIDGNGYPVPGTVPMVQSLIADGVRVFLVSNDGYSQSLAQAYGVSPTDLLSAQSVGNTKGTGAFVRHVLNATGGNVNEILYLGDDDKDMREAVNNNVFFLTAGWSQNPKPTQYGLSFPYPTRVHRAIHVWFNKQYLWYFTADGVDTLDRPFHYRSLMDPDRAKNSGVRDLLKKGIGDRKVEKHLTGHLLGSVFVEGLLSKDSNGRHPILCVYPGSKGQINATLQRFAQLSTQIFKSRFFPDLIVRHRPSIKSAYNRDTIDLANQIQTVHLDPSLAPKIIGKRVIVFDDFTTEGYSLETARNLLYNAGCSEVFCITAGKYPRPTKIFSPKVNGWSSTVPVPLGNDSFTHFTVRGTFNLFASNQY